MPKWIDRRPDGSVVITIGPGVGSDRVIMLARDCPVAEGPTMAMDASDEQVEAFALELVARYGAYPGR